MAGGAVLAALAVLAAMAPATGAARRPVVPRDCTHEAVKPKRIVVACGDGNFFLTKLRWSSWGKKSARGSGTGNLNDCKPACFKGHFHKYPVKVRLSRPKTCPAASAAQFRRITITYTGKRPAGAKRTSSAPMDCPL